mmetsp:Transcript_40621/g.117469  ORF Transcript_40621/g.117469 Transcript_40621/m.117469 type:complete len:363 (+) Transcript_40621:407-1495(+)
MWKHSVRMLSRIHVHISSRLSWYTKKDAILPNWNFATNTASTNTSKEAHASRQWHMSSKRTCFSTVIGANHRTKKAAVESNGMMKANAKSTVCTITEPTSWLPPFVIATPRLYKLYSRVSVVGSRMRALKTPEVAKEKEGTKALMRTAAPVAERPAVSSHRWRRASANFARACRSDFWAGGSERIAPPPFASAARVCKKVVTWPTTKDKTVAATNEKNAFFGTGTTCMAMLSPPAMLCHWILYDSNARTVKKVSTRLYFPYWSKKRSSLPRFSTLNLEESAFQANAMRLNFITGQRPLKPKTKKAKSQACALIASRTQVPRAKAKAAGIVTAWPPASTTRLTTVPKPTSAKTKSSNAAPMRL